jgi:hypothetical protein
LAELHMKMSKKAERVAKFGNNMRPNLRRGIQRAATMLQGHIKQLLSGQSHTRVPGNPNPYPGVLSNRLRSSVTVDMGRDGRSAKVGPNMVYGPALEFGHPRWKSGVRYPFMGPAQKQKGGDVIKIIDDELLKGF